MVEVKGFIRRGTDCITRCVWKLTVALWWSLFCRCFLALCPGDWWCRCCHSSARNFLERWPQWAAESLIERVVDILKRDVQRQARLKNNRQTEILGVWDTWHVIHKCPPSYFASKKRPTRETTPVSWPETASLCQAQASANGLLIVGCLDSDLMPCGPASTWCAAWGSGQHRVRCLRWLYAQQSRTKKSKLM